MPAERFVLDASVAVEWFLPSGGPGGRYAEGILERLERIGGEELVPAVPDLWHYELGSVLIAAKRDKRISAAKLRASQLAIRGLQPAATPFIKGVKEPSADDLVESLDYVRKLLG